MSGKSMKLRDAALKAIKRLLAHSISSSNIKEDLDLAEAHRGMLEEQWCKFDTAHKEVLEACGPEAIHDQDELFEQAETWVMEARANFNRIIRLLNKTEQANHPTTPNTNAEVPQSPPLNHGTSWALPTMPLPQFAGDPTEWITFNDTFKALVDSNKNITGMQKMHYLRSCLRGEALQLVNNLKNTDANYKEAWALLENRYKALRVIITQHLDAITRIKTAKSDSAVDIKNVFDAVLLHVRALKALGRPTQFWDDWIIHTTVSRLAYETRKEWELSLPDDNPPTFDELQSFIEKRCRSLNMLPQASEVQHKSSKNSTKAQNVFHANTTTPEEKCWFCNDSTHKIYTCAKFIKLSAALKLSTIQEKSACLNCLSKFHRADSCRSPHTCKTCKCRHHTIMHNAVTTKSIPDNNNPSAPHTSATPYTPECFSQPLSAREASHTLSHNTCFASPSTNLRQAMNTSSHNAATVGGILLATALVRVQDSSGRWQPARVLFDSGSHATFVTEHCIQRLQLPRSASSIDITGIGSTTGLKTHGEAKIAISPRSSNQSTFISAQILHKITNNLPACKLQKPNWPHIQNLRLADPYFNQPGHVDILIGMDEMDKFLLTNLLKGEPGTPIAQETIFGWVLFGRTDNSKYANHDNIQVFHCDAKLVKTLAKFWELEELPPRRHLTVDESYCEDLFNNTHERAADGRFIVQLPLKPNVEIGESRTTALRSWLRMEKRLVANDGMRLQYNAFMDELINMHHMEAVTDIPKTCFYMPHHAVIKETSTTTKLRVVFNASAKSSNGVSLNDALLVGPQLQRDLFTVLLRFRFHQYVMAADVEKMYRQVRISTKHQDLQRIVWRRDPAEPIQDFKMLRVTYGTASASHLAVKALQQTAFIDDPLYKDAANAILNDFYMDDLLTGASTIDDLIKLQVNVSKLLADGGFELRKWATNCRQLLTQLPDRAENITQYIAAEEQIHTLGIVWNTEQDFFTFTTRLKPTLPTLTKRAFLSEASLIFDPLGFIAPVTIRAKIWFQQIWETKADWDDPVPADITKAWYLHREDLKTLEALKLNRWLGTDQHSMRTELHIFADASERAYAAVIYARTFTNNGNVNVAYVTAKAKVAPLKSTRLPRLELCAAHLAARLVRSVLNCFEDFSFRLHAWTDSAVTLAWLQGHPSRWTTFVANRVADIQEVLPAECWNHIRSECNPADCASRGVSPSDLLNHQLWWQGPPWLHDPTVLHKSNNEDPYVTDLELRSRKVAAHVAQSEMTWDFLERYSSYERLKRVTAYMLRFIYNARAKGSSARGSFGTLRLAELAAAENALIKYSQNGAFFKEINCCRDRRPLPRRSNLLRLQPFLDNDGILRVGGRIARAELTVDQKFPILLPKGSPLATLIVNYIHRVTMHAGPQTMQAVLLRRFWVIDARNLIRKLYRRCTKCQLLNHQPQQQQMGDLPKNRVTPARCFLRSAVDYAGPYSFKFAPGRGSKSIKGYICVFICMCTGAMHLEFVGGLSSNDFINAFKRFINRRGYCHHIHSDNGTNFVGAERELRQTLEKCLADPTVTTYFQNCNITWHFNPPSAPHMGGYWEVGVKRVKYHLKRTLGDTLLTFEEFSTLLTEIEACVNSRPLCAAESSDVGDLDALTPGHFLLGEPLKSLPCPETQEFEGGIHRRHQIISSMRQHFWKRWRNEYLTKLQKRTKWFRPSANINEDDVVAIIEENAPPTRWKLGRVLECHPGADGRVRVVTLKTADGQFKRPIAKLCVLPTKQDLFE